MSNYIPSKKILDNYANILLNFALNGGKGIKKGETVLISVPECARPFYDNLYRCAILVGANPIMRLIPEGNEVFFYENATDEQLSFFPGKYYKGLLDQIDHQISIIADADPQVLNDIDSTKIFKRQSAFKSYSKWHEEKESAGKLSYTLCLYGTSAMAKEANISLEEYWEQIIEACYLDDKNSLEKWKNFKEEIEDTKKKLDDLEIKSLHVVSKNIDLTIGLGKQRKWLGMSCRNIPSFEIFISPNWRETRGYIQFNKSLHRYGKLIDGVCVKFGDDGKVKSATATTGEEVLLEMLKQKNADKLGEFSLTDKRYSRISKYMASTLYDENVGGPYGNTHVAFGNAYKDSFFGDKSSLSKSNWEELGFNESSVHTDIISTEDRVVTATLANDEKKVIYKNGMFTL